MRTTSSWPCDFVTPPARERGIEEKQMFGGAGFLLHGNMLVGVREDSLIVRVGPDGYGDVLLEPHVGEFDVTGRPMKEIGRASCRERVLWYV